MFGPSRELWHSRLEGSVGRIRIGVGLGLCFGAALGAAMRNVAVGVALGAAIGVACSLIFGASVERSARKKAASDKPLPHPLGL